MNFKSRVITHEAISGVTGGLFIAIQGLFFMEKGAEVWQIGLLFGAAVVSTSIFELPFGALADIYGRIKVFRLARTVFLIAAAIAVFATNFWHLLLTMTLFGMAEALKTGSIDAWAAEQINARGESEKLQSYISVFKSCLAAGLAVGAIGGGYLPVVMPKLESFPPTTWNMIFICIFVVLHLSITPYLFKEGEELRTGQKDADMFRKIWSGVKFSMTNCGLRDLMLVGLLLGLAMISVEAYWQPHLTLLAGEPSYALLGWTAAGYFGMAIVGPMLVTSIAARFNISPRVQLLVLPIGLSLILYIIAKQAGIYPFIAAYMTGMLVMSMFDPPLATVLNNETPDELRSTMHSIFSIALRGGATIAAFGFAGLVKLWGITQVWQLVAAITLFAGVIRILDSCRQRSVATQD